MRAIQSKLNLVGFGVLAGLFLPATAANVPASFGTPAAQEIVDHYVQALAQEKAQPQDLTMDVSIDAQLPRLKKRGSLHALRFVSRLGRTVYRGLRFEGDDTIKKEVITRYLTAEREAESGSGPSLAVTPENYKFSYKGTAAYGPNQAYVFQVTPKQKRGGLFAGELWIDTQTYLPLREWGELVKNPSIFLKDVYFVRDYYLYHGRSVPRRIISAVDTRLVGKAEMTIWFDNFALGRPAEINFADGD